MKYDINTFSERAMNDLEPLIEFWCHRYNIYGMDNEDVEQEVRLHLWRKLKRFKHDQGTSIYTWGNNVVRNRLRDLFRSGIRENTSKTTIFSKESQRIENYCNDPIEIGDLIDFCDEHSLNLEDFL